MGKRKVTILEPAVEEVARIALYIEGGGLPITAKRFVDDAFAFFESLADDRKFIAHVSTRHGKDWGCAVRTSGRSISFLILTILMRLLSVNLHCKNC